MPDREKVFDAIRNCITEQKCSGCLWDECEKFDCKMVGVPVSLMLDALKLLKEQEVKNGYWINPTSQDCHCSECGEQPVHEPGESVPLYDFCPYCGAKMEEKWNDYKRKRND
jgi:hypothetical protein